MLHVRLLVPVGLVEQVLALLETDESVTNVVHLPGAARSPAGDVVLCDVARENASVVLGELRALGLEEVGSISADAVDISLSRSSEAAERAAAGSPADAVVWEEVAERTNEEAELSATFVAFATLAMLIAAVGILTDSVVLIIGAMIVGPEFGPIAGICVALVERRPALARRSLLALAVAFPAGITAAFLATAGARWAGAVGDTVEPHRTQTLFVSHPNGWSLLVALLAGTAGMLSLTSAKSGALIGVLVSVTTIPAAANIGVAAAYGNGSEWSGATEQLTLNVAALVLAGVATLTVQRIGFVRRLNARRARAGP